MPNTSFTRRSSAEVAQRVADNIDQHLAGQGRNRDWLAGELDLSGQRLDAILTTQIPFALVIDVADVLGISWGDLA